MSALSTNCVPHIAAGNGPQKSVLDRLIVEIFYEGILRKTYPLSSVFLEKHFPGLDNMDNTSAFIRNLIMVLDNTLIML